MKLGRQDMTDEFLAELDRPNNIFDNFEKSYRSVMLPEFLTVRKTESGKYAFGTDKLDTDVNKIVLTETDFITEEETEVGDDPLYTRTSINDPYFLTSGLNNVRFPSAMNVVLASTSENIGAKVYKYKCHGRFVIIYTVTGTLKCYDVKDGRITKVFEHNIVEQIRNNFAIPEFQIFDVLDICPSGSIVLVSTKRNGIFAVYPDKGASSRYISAPDVNNATRLEGLPGKRLLILTNTLSKANVKVWNIDGTPGEISSYNHLRLDSQQKPIDADVSQDYFAVLGTPLENGYSTQNIHLWRRNQSGEYKNIDTEMFPHTNDASYNVRITQISDNKLYVIGDNNDGIFIWEWDINNLSKEYKEYTFKYHNLSKIDKFYISGGVATFDIGNRIVTYNLESKQVEANYLLDATSDIIWFRQKDGSLVVLSDDEIKIFKTPEYTDNPKIAVTAKSDSTFISNIYIKCDNVSALRVGASDKSGPDIAARMIIISDNELVIKTSSLKSGGHITYNIELVGSNRVHFMSQRTTKVYMV